MRSGLLTVYREQLPRIRAHEALHDRLVIVTALGLGDKPIVEGIVRQWIDEAKIKSQPLKPSLTIPNVPGVKTVIVKKKSVK